jgi:glycolate oxidase FAD binding subunit
MDYALSQLCEQVTTARANLQPIEILGGGTKRFYGNALATAGHVCRLDLSGLSGVVTYEPSELVVTALAGTPLTEIEQTLAERGQMLAFDPPRFGQGSTIGGVVASGLSGPLSFGYGPLRHYVLGAHLLDAQGRVLKFGGEVMKNVAGYDVSRLVAGSLGMFGVIVQVSLKVLPVPKRDETLLFELNEADALARCRGFRARAMPIRAAAWLPDARSSSESNSRCNGQLAIRLAGADSAVEQAMSELGGQRMDATEAQQWWMAMRDQTAPFFASGALWRLALRAQTPTLDLGSTAFDLGGEVRWLTGVEDADRVREVALACGGHATLFRPSADEPIPADGVFQPLTPTARSIVQRLKKEFDPKSLFNPGRLVAGI